jgi:glutathione S-transferase
MILIGQYDSPFVRRVGIALRLYGLEFEHRPWAAFADSEKIGHYNPLMRVPTLVMDDGEVLTESWAILDALDFMAGPEKALIPLSGPQRRHVQQVCALATGLADKVVSLIYERAVHRRETDVWVNRCRSQIEHALDALDGDRSHSQAAWWFGPALSHADIAVACAMGLMRDALGDMFDMLERPALRNHAAACEALPVFAEIRQAFYLTPPT